MGIWRMDRKSAIYIAEHLDELMEGFPLCHCDKCDSDYLEEVGHEHNDYIDFETETKDIPEDKDPRKIVHTWHSYSSTQDREEVWDDVFNIITGKENTYGNM